ncbi:MAG TPA: phenylalanine--tRNA ligase subunit alpha [Proteobacteria bacterium]|nr:phenylalanine--tRNA ligase subunit alpha [Pseudomonadota bacterium]
MEKEYQSALEAQKSVSSLQELEEFRIRFIGKKGTISAFYKQLSQLDSTSKRKIGELLNRVRGELVEWYEAKRAEFKRAEREKELLAERVDVTLPGRRVGSGRLHPITQTMREIIDVFCHLGFWVEEGPDVELDFYNFEALNFPPEHPARDMQDTLYFTDEVLLRTHTSPVQIRVMQKRKPPIRIVAPGAVYRHDSDVSHSPMFHQVEGLLVDERVTFAELKGVLIQFAKEFFGPNTPMRFRPSFFPFTEPSAEVDIGCVFCKGSGCRVCKESGWLEILGAGMVHPAVFEAVDYDPERYVGFAFGMGVERIAMLKFGIDDIRLFFENDIRFLRQF